MSRLGRPAPCPPPEDLTALAHGEGSAEERARLLRHLLGCPPCHALHGAALAVLGALADAGAARATRAPWPGPAAQGASRAAWGWSLLPPAAAAAVVAGLLLLPAAAPAAPARDPAGAVPRPPAESASGPGAPAGTGAAAVQPEGGLSEEARLRLLAGQAGDGRWPALGAGPGPGGEASATALALLALLKAGPPTAGDPATLVAVSAALRWLEAEAPALARRAPTGLDHVRAAALATTALLRAQRVQPDARTEAGLGLLLPALAAAVPAGAADHATRPWLEQALALAEQQGSRPAARAHRVLAAVPAPPSPDAPRPRPPPTHDCTAVDLALEALREEPPVRLLALAPRCRAAVAPAR